MEECGGTIRRACCLPTWRVEVQLLCDRGEVSKRRQPDMQIKEDKTTREQIGSRLNKVNLGFKF